MEVINCAKESERCPRCKGARRIYWGLDGIAFSFCFICGSYEIHHTWGGKRFKQFIKVKNNILRQWIKY